MVTVSFAPEARKTLSKPLSTLSGSPAELGKPRYSCGISVPSKEPVLVKMKETEPEEAEASIDSEEYANVVYERPYPNS